MIIIIVYQDSLLWCCSLARHVYVQYTHYLVADLYFIGHFIKRLLRNAFNCDIVAGMRY